jgi:protein PhnA
VFFPILRLPACCEAASLRAPLVDQVGRNFLPENELETKDCFGNVLSAGDSVMVIKDLKVKGTSVTLKQGTKIKNIRLTDSEDQIECNSDKVKGLVLRTEFLKKV